MSSEATPAAGAEALEAGTAEADGGGGDAGAAGPRGVGDEAGGGTADAETHGAAGTKPQERDTAETHSLSRDLFRNPTGWQVWPAVALLRWLLRHHNQGRYRRLIYRALPSLAFQGNEIHGVALREDAIELTLTAPGVASPGSPLPLSDIERIVVERRPPGRGALSAWLDGLTDLLMQIAESARARYSTAFALATGGEAYAVRQAANLAGHTAPLRAMPGHRLAAGVGAPPQGAAGLAALFAGAPSAHGLKTLLGAFAGVSARVDEFTGGRVRTLRPALIGGPPLRILGAHCTLPAAGVEVTLEGGGAEAAHLWATEPERCASLRLMCERYIGGGGIAVSLFLELDADNTAPATLGETMLGGMAVLGAPPDNVRLPLRA